MTIALFSVSLTAGHGHDDAERMKHMSEKYKKYAERNKSRKLSSCDMKASEEVKKAAEKIVNISHQIGKKEEALSKAYLKGKQNLIKKLHEEKHELETKRNIAEKEKHIGYLKNEINRALEKNPNSEKLQKLKKIIDKDCNDYIKTAKEVIRLHEKEKEIHDNLRRRIKQIEIIRKEKELKQLKEENNMDDFSL